MSRCTVAASMRSLVASTAASDPSSLVPASAEAGREEEGPMFVASSFTESRFDTLELESHFSRLDWNRIQNRNFHQKEQEIKCVNKF